MTTKKAQNYTIFGLVLFSWIFILMRLTATLYVTQVINFNPADSNGQPKLKGNTLFRDTDNVAWIMHAKEAMQQGKWIIREVHWDGYPNGRAMHWSSPIIWAMIVGTRIQQAISGADIDTAADAAVPFVYTTFYLISTLILAYLAVKGYGIKYGGLYYLSIFSALGIFWLQSHPLLLDHHTLMLTCLSIIFGGIGLLCTKQATAKIAIIVGAASGLAIWVSAITAIPSIVIPLLCVGCIAIYIKFKKLTPISNPTHWQIFGIVTTAFSFVAYFIEYGFNTAWRMEVNNPMYGLAILGGSYILSKIVQVQESTYRTRKIDILLCLISIVFMVIPFVYLAIYGADVFTLLSPYWERVPQAVAEGLPMSIDTITLRIGLLGAVIILMLVGARLYSMPNLQVWPLILAAIVFGCLACTAARMASTFEIMLVTAIICSLKSDAVKWKTINEIIVVLICSSIFINIVSIYQDIRSIKRYGLQNIAASNAAKLAAEVIIDDSKKQNVEPTITAVPDIATFLAYYTGGKISAGIYWESFPNWEKTTNLLYTEDIKEGAKKLLELGTNYLVLTKESRTWAFVDLGVKGIYPNKKDFYSTIINEGTRPNWLVQVSGNNDELLVFRNDYKRIKQ